MNAEKELEYKRIIAESVQRLELAEYPLVKLIATVANIKEGELITKHHLTDLKKYTKKLKDDNRITKSIVRLKYLLKL